MSTIGSRLREVRKEQSTKMTQAIFAQETHVSPAAYSVYEIDRVIPSDVYLQVVATTFGITFDWLKHGTQPKYQAELEDSAAALVPELVAVLDDNPTLLRLVKKAAINMTAADWKRLAELVEAFTASD